MTSRPPTFDAPPFPIPSGGGSSSAASSASSASLSDSATLHAYPPAPASSKRHKSLEYRDDPDSRGGVGEREEGEEEEETGLLDEERSVGEMMRDRAEKTTPAKQSSSSRRRGLIIVASVFFGLILSIPILSWLSSGISTGSVLDVNRDAAWLLPNSITSKKQLRPLPKYDVARDDTAGQRGLLNARGFTLDYVAEGWRDAGEAGKLLGVELDTKRKSGKLPTMDTIMDGVFYPSTSDIRWSKEDPDEGVFTHKDPETGDLIVEDVTHLRKNMTGQGEVAKGGGKVLYVKAEDVKDQHGQRLRWSTFLISPDMSQVLFSTDVEHRWRYSSYKNVWLHDVAAKKTTPVGGGPHYPAKTMGIAWAPRGPDGLGGASFSYVIDNDLYVQTADGKSLRVTDDGTEQVFNAIPDWAYEEEVYKETEHVSWWSSSGTKLAYLRLDETAVPVYSYPIYNSNSMQAGLTTPYVKMAKMKYPKPGFPNPLVSAHVVDISRLASGSTSAEAKVELKSPKGNSRPEASTREKDLVDTALGGERLIAEVVWTGDEELLLRETNRVSDAARTIKFDLGRDASRQAEVVGDVVRWQSSQKEGGWIAASQEIVALGPLSKTETTAYLDVIPDAAGFRHIAYYENAGVAEPLFLTKGEWEVDELRHTDIKRRRVYFIAGSPTPSQRHIFSIELPDLASPSSAKDYKVASPVALTDTTKPGWYSASFDPKGAYYLLNYQGPSVPWVKVLGIDNAEFHLTLESNAELKSTLAKYAMPTLVYYSLKTDHGVVVAACEKRPHDFDASGRTRYPVLFDVYGGPDSQTVKATFAATNWHTYLVEYLGFIVIQVDGRGTGFKGRKYRTSITGRLGQDEVQDVIGAMKQIRRLPYVDETRTGVWGWSYGGYLTTKIVEADSGQFSLGMAVAPVSRWEFYDSIYTERYMKLPATNKAGYNNASVHITEGFRNTHYLLAQGSGDDNVHFESSAHLLDMLTSAHVHGFAFRMFTDSTHSISLRGAWRELHEFLTAFLVANWGAGGLRRFEGKTANLLHLVDSRAVAEQEERRTQMDVESILRRRRASLEQR